MADDDFAADTIFGETAFQIDDPFCRKRRGYFKKLWGFFEPYDRFLYVDADMLALRPLDTLVEYVARAEKPFFIASDSTSFQEKLRSVDEGEHRRLLAAMCGDSRLTEYFDPAYDWRSAVPFNSGFFATHRDLIGKKHLREVFESAQQLHAERGLPPFYRSREGLFMSDQGLINYLVYKSGTKPDLIPELFIWGGRTVKQFESARACCADNFLRGLFVHWADCPQPTFLRRSVPAGKEGIDCYRTY